MKFYFYSHFIIFFFFFFFLASNGEALKYQPGHTYEYQVTSSAKTNINGAEDGEKLDVTATALLTATGDCNYVLRVKNVKVDARGNFTYI